MTLVAAMCVLVACTPFGTKRVTSGRLPGAVVAGKDGNLWLTAGLDGIQRIGRNTTAGVVTEISIAPSSAEMLAVAPDLWFSTVYDNEIVCVTPSGKVSLFTVLQNLPFYAKA